MISYPILSKGATIGVTAPSSGVGQELHHLLTLACEKMEEKGYHVVCGETAWSQHKAKSAPAKRRADEFNKMVNDENVDLIIPPWGGELLVEILEYLDFENMKKKWILGYSDISVLLLALTLKTGIATAHGTNLVDLRGDFSDETTAMWEEVLSTQAGESVLQHSSEKYQNKWRHEQVSPCVFHLTEQTTWKTVSSKDEHVKGRLLGGCIDVIRHIIGTPVGDVKAFQEKFLKGEPILWYLENCELNTADVRRSLVQMKLAGWFDNCSGILFGRSSADMPVDNYTILDVYEELAEELNVPIIYDIDCGHQPPQITFINGAYAEVTTKDGKGKVLQTFI
ncbi:S66 peptidase family protein [Fredinandcohnia sp. 179-A 10B2 NHS]|uniref:S66 family peptidase n=1 Tax=Fredinandcohnia sp. 179-A 10B2 NHS TaxID=3235176 RepID=UPI0039A386C3